MVLAKGRSVLGMTLLIIGGECHVSSRPEPQAGLAMSVLGPTASQAPPGPIWLMRGKAALLPAQLVAALDYVSSIDLLLDSIQMSLPPPLEGDGRSARRCS